MYGKAKRGQILQISNITKCMGRTSGVKFAKAGGERKLCRTARDLSGRGEKFVGCKTRSKKLVASDITEFCFIPTSSMGFGYKLALCV